MSIEEAIEHLWHGRFTEALEVLQALRNAAVKDEASRLAGIIKLVHLSANAKAGALEELEAMRK